MKINNVGLDMDSLKNENGVITGRGTIYSQDEDDLQLEYEDDFTFTYDTADGLVVANVDENIFGDYLELIDMMLVDNLKINYLDYLE